MMNCTRCQNAFDPTRSAVCPFCGAPVSAPQATAAPRRRVSLTGEEVIDEAPPAPPPPQPLPGQALPPRQPLPPQGGPPRAQAPVRPPVDTAPAMLDGERRFFRILWTVLGVLGVAALIGSFFLFNRYAEGQRKYEQESHLHLSTPKAAASEVIYSMRQDAMSRLFLVTQFSDDRQKDLLEAKAFTIGTHISEHLVPGSSDTLGSVFHSMTKIQYGEPQGKGDHQDVPVTATIKMDGKEQAIQGVVHLSNAEDGKWRLDCSKSNASDGESLSKVLLAILGVQPAQPDTPGLPNSSQYPSFPNTQR